MKTTTLDTARLTLLADTAEELMTNHPVSVDENAALREALAMLLDRGYHAAPVIDAAGRPVGVLSRSDLLMHDRESVDYLCEVPEFYSKGDLATSDGEALTEGFQVERFDTTLVRDVMTPVVYCVSPETPAVKVVSDLLSLNVHRLFVVDERGVLVGVISTMDVLRQMRVPEVVESAEDEEETPEPHGCMHEVW